MASVCGGVHSAAIRDEADITQTRCASWFASQHRTSGIPSAQSLTVGSLPEVRSWYALLYDHRTRPAHRKRSPRHRAHHHRVASAELATRLLVDCQLEGTERCAAHRHCRKG